IVGPFLERLLREAERLFEVVQVLLHCVGRWIALARLRRGAGNEDQSRDEQEKSQKNRLSVDHDCPFVGFRLSCCFTWKKSFSDELSARRNGDRVVNCQNVDGGPANGGSTDQNWPLPTEMAMPRVAARIKEPCEFAGLGIKTGNIRPFVAVTTQAGQSPIIPLR